MSQIETNRLSRWTPWLVVCFSCASLMVSNGFTISGITAFDTVLLETFNWNRPEYKFRESITLLFAGIFAPIAGYFLDRYGVRKCLMIGWAVLIFCQLAYPLAPNLQTLYFIHMLLAIVLVLCGLNACVILTSNWIIDGRGRAIGLTLAGSSLGGALVAQFNTSTLALFGWELSFRLGAIFPLLLLLISWLWLKDVPDKISTASTNLHTGAAGSEEGVSFLDALKSLSFWMLALIAMSTFFTVLGVQANLRLHLIDLGLGEQGATTIFGLFFVAAMTGKFLFGALSDYLSLRWVFNLNMAVMLVGALLLCSLNKTLIYPALVAFGFGWGGAYAMIQLSVINIFGLKNSGKILGAITILDALGGAAGIFIVAKMQAQFGNYQLAFLLCSGLIAFAWLCFTQVRFHVNQRATPA